MNRHLPPFKRRKRGRKERRRVQRAAGRTRRRTRNEEERNEENQIKKLKIRRDSLVEDAGLGERLGEVEPRLA